MGVARDMFRQSLNVLDDLRSSAGDLGVNELYAKAIAGEIARCETALER